MLRLTREKVKATAAAQRKEIPAGAGIAFFNRRAALPPADSACFSQLTMMIPHRDALSA